MPSAGEHTTTSRAGSIRREYHMTGVVQGVGFRPFWSALGQDFSVSGIIGNTGNDVYLRLEGTVDDIEAFITHGLAHLPPLAQVTHVEYTQQAATGEFAPGIAVAASTQGEAHHTRTLIPADVALCADCAHDMADPTNRRHQYPFTTCTNCGPRLSIITGLPYDRPRTTLKNFPLCPDCEHEYTDLTNRRYHAQPISCFSCGPRLWWEDSTQTHQAPDNHPASGAVAGADIDDTAPAGLAPWNREESNRIIAHAQKVIARGGIIAVKGIGGFHLLADASNTHTIARLRQLKNRPHKPLAVLVTDLNMARTIVDLDEPTTGQLTHPARPIVLLPQAEHSPLSPLVAPGLDEIGVVLSYNPLYDLLVDRPLVCTSGNPAGEPLCHTNAAARQHLTHMVDGFIFHNRPICVPVEDSVEKPHTPIRRSRGRAPLPIDITGWARTPRIVIGVGGELKNTVCISDHTNAFLSAHIGDMGSMAAHTAWHTALKTLLDSRGLSWDDVDLLVADKHPNYSTTTLATNLSEQRDIPLASVQHHHAHALSLIAEHNHIGAAVIATLDGTGYGDDGTIYGGEILALGNNPADELTRAWHLPRFPLVGGDRAVIHPWRILAGLNHAYHLDLPADCGTATSTPAGPFTIEEEITLVNHQITTRTGTVDTTSLGRLLDGLACLILGLSHQTYEGHAPMLLEAAAHRATPTQRAHAQQWAREPATIVELTHAVVRRQHELHLTPGHPTNNPATHELAHGLHLGLAHIIATHLHQTATEHNTTFLGLTGGSAVNALLSHTIAKHLLEAGLHLHTHQKIPPTDGGLSLGQVTYGLATHTRA
ncbi:hypothetical protein CAQU_01900 [Corynebacterium aquilae DSM 44791]|uniref:Carbamoyltransferase n=2 Tax=Corynebacterium aquilae TaxID=203263 RepID=A0A1L7CDW2_9CORY|nr:hypothetical protein CAQU_01900 [Corynebacterium aquilae DSM 44791]